MGRLRTIAQLKRNPRKKIQQSFPTYFLKKGEKRKKNKEKRKKKERRREEKKIEVETSDENILAKVQTKNHKQKRGIIYEE